MTFDPVNLQDSIPRISCNKGEVHMPEDICFNIHEWQKKKILASTQVLKTRGPVRETVVPTNGKQDSITKDVYNNC